MSITKEQKREIIDDLSGRFSKSKAIVFLGFQGLTAMDNISLRRKLRNEEVEYKVAKKTLLKKGLEEAKFENSKELNLDGPVAVAIGYDDEVAPARLANEYAKENKKLKLLGGFIEMKYLDAVEIKELALLPGKEQLRAQLVGTINAPVSGFVNVLAGSMRGLVNTLKAIGENKEK
ncbi:MAG: 50S ribosomal protein L10 [Patescibacteria group bacterium]|nr:50S ribosomal protein L10 [Patescibacteria group bacterium]